MANRLPLDAHLIGYWGFDEALETDAAIDATANALNLTVTASPSTFPGRVGNARNFNGTSTFASVTSGLLRLTGDATFLGWGKLNSYNAAGSQLRCLLSCGGPTTGDNSLYCVSVTLSGELRYSHTSASGEVVVKTAASTIKTGQFYFIAVRRIANGGNQDIEFIVDNVSKPIASVTVNGSPSSLPVPPPAANASAIFSVGRSQKETNSAFWDGPIDEVSVHDVARPYHAYLLDAFYRAALRSATTKLSATNTVVAVSSYDMGAGVRWWVFERDKDLYAVRESPFGSFGSETRLTTVGGGNSSLTGSPELIYDAATDTLYVFFVSGNRIFKLTANSTDDPATINMPYTADTGTIIKSVDNVEGGRLGQQGGGQREVLTSDFTYVNRSPIKLNIEELNHPLGQAGGGQQASINSGLSHAPNVAFLQHPTLGFGVIIGYPDSEQGGFAAYIVDGGVAIPQAAPTQLTDSTRRYFFPISVRVYGRGYLVEALDLNGRKSGLFSEILIDSFNEGVVNPNGATLHFGRNGDGQESGSFGQQGGGQREVLTADFTYVNRTPLKISFQDPDTNNLGQAGGGQSGTVTNGSTNRPVDPGKVFYV